MKSVTTLTLQLDEGFAYNSGAQAGDGVGGPTLVGGGVMAVDNGLSKTDSLTDLVEIYAREHPEAGEWARELREAVKAREDAGMSAPNDLPVAQYSITAAQNS